MRGAEETSQHQSNVHFIPECFVAVVCECAVAELDDAVDDDADADDAADDDVSLVHSCFVISIDSSFENQNDTWLNTIETDLHLIRKIDRAVKTTKLQLYQTKF